MIQIPLTNKPNQSFTIRLDNRVYNFTIKLTNNVMSATIVRDNEIVISNNRIVSGAPLLNYKHQESGNFIFLTENNDLPYYDKFNITQFLIYASEAELDELRSS